MGRMSRDKGKTWERAVASMLRAIFGDGVKRGWQARQGSDAPDVEGVPFWVEAKHHAVVNIGAAVRQALDAAKKARSKLPVLIASKSNRQEPLATMLLEDWLKLVEELVNLRAAVDKQVPSVRGAVEMWRAAHPGNEKTWPDLGDLVDWLVARGNPPAQVDVGYEAAKEGMRELLNRAVYGTEPEPGPAMQKAKSTNWTCPGHDSKLEPCPGGVFPPAPSYDDEIATGPFLCVSARNTRALR